MGNTSKLSTHVLQLGLRMLVSNMTPTVYFCACLDFWLASPPRLSVHASLLQCGEVELTQ